MVKRTQVKFGFDPTLQICSPKLQLWFPHYVVIKLDLVNGLVLDITLPGYIKDQEEGNIWIPTWNFACYAIND